MASDKAIFGTIFGLFLIAVFTVLFLPMVQSIAYVLLIKTPAFWYWLLVGGAVAALVAKYTGSEELVLMTLGLALVMALVVGPVLSGTYGQKHVANNQDFQEVEALDNTSEDHVRVLPRAVADRYTGSSMQYPVYQLSDSDITYHDGRYTWSYGIIPDRFMVVWFGNQHGAAFTDMETGSKDVQFVEKEMQCGQGQVFLDSYGYKMNVNRLDVNHKPNTAFNLIHEEEIHVAQSYTTHEWHFGNPLNGGLPQPYVVPRYGGTQIIDSECNVEDVPASEVPEHEALDRQSTYPYDLAIFRTTAVRYRKGILNAWFVGQGVPMLAETPGDDMSNSQPYTVPTEGGELKYFVAMEPSGSGKGVYQVYMLDAQTGDVKFVEFNDSQTGPQRAADYVRKESPKVNWQTGDGDESSGTMTMSEPIPIVKDGTLYWQVRVVPADSTGLSFTAFVNAETAEVTEVKGDSEIYAFLSGSEVRELNGTQPSGSPNDGLTIAVVDNGTVVETVQVSGNATIEVTQNNRTDS